MGRHFGSICALALIWASPAFAQGGDAAASPAVDALTITRQTISLSSARRMMAAAGAEARRNKVDVSIVIVDDRGEHILAERMDGAGVASFYIATAKARTSADVQATTAEIGAAVKAGASELTTLAGHLPYPGGMAVIGGGVPVRYRASVIGAVGVSGAEPEIDARIAVAAANVLSDQK